MLIDMTFRVEMTLDRLLSIQETLADCTNTVQFDRWLTSTIKVPSPKGQMDYRFQGLLVGVKEFHVGEDVYKDKNERKTI